ncbi:MAG TPA: hypothetical protein VGZ93_05860 [Candidatus Methylacidiphilales bacterium]|jgi:hypothetical protein|nr:hypothetical protein [Candidatus Methylacidiphilales bacterium]
MILKLFQDGVRSSRSLTDGKRSKQQVDSAVDLTLEILQKITAGFRVKSLNVRLSNNL